MTERGSKSQKQRLLAFIFFSSFHINDHILRREIVSKQFMGATSTPLCPTLAVSELHSCFMEIRSAASLQLGACQNKRNIYGNKSDKSRCWRRLQIDFSDKKEIKANKEGYAKGENLKIVSRKIN